MAGTFCNISNHAHERETNSVRGSGFQASFGVNFGMDSSPNFRKRENYAFFSLCHSPSCVVLNPSDSRGMVDRLSTSSNSLHRWRKYLGSLPLGSFA
ncbi:hypothetical protein [Geothrix oryzae]|uniref:hypothetical protein n=1 Tax=Geothrix oryzae TaxID=2927975 RepID=UPI0025742212|nr:hypothetical protein [Geothrix oryzae]